MSSTESGGHEVRGWWLIRLWCCTSTVPECCTSMRCSNRYTGSSRKAIGGRRSTSRFCLKTSLRSHSEKWFTGTPHPSEKPRPRPALTGHSIILQSSARYMFTMLLPQPTHPLLRPSHNKILSMRENPIIGI